MRNIVLIFTVCLGLGGSCGSVVSAAIAQQDVLLLLENSSRMQQIDPEFSTRTAVGRFLESRSDQTRISILLYDDRVIPLGELTPITESTRATFIKNLKQWNYSGRHTNSAAAMERAIYELKTNGRQEAQKSIIYLTDSVIDTGDQRQDQEFSQWLREILADEAAQAGIRIFGIGLTDAADFRIIQTLAHKTGGAYYRIGAPAELESAFDKINARLGTPSSVSLAPGSRAGSTQQPGKEALGVSVADPTQASSTPPLQSEIQPPTATAPETVAQQQRTPTARLTPAEEKTSMGPPSTAHQQGAVAWISENATLLIILCGVIVIGAVAIAGLAVWRRKRSERAPSQAKQTQSSSAYTPPAALEDIGGITSKQSYDITGKLTWISRAHGEDSATTRTIVIRNDLISRDHAVIQYKNFGYWIADRGSINGTFVNDKRITEEHLLKHGDRIRFAKFEFGFAMPQREDLAATVYVKAVSDGARPPQGSANTREIQTTDAYFQDQSEPQSIQQEAKTEQVRNISTRQPDDTAVSDTVDDAQKTALHTPQQKAETIPEQANYKSTTPPDDAQQIPLDGKGNTEEIANVDLLKEITDQSSAEEELANAAGGSSKQTEAAEKTQNTLVKSPADGLDQTVVANLKSESADQVLQDQIPAAVDDLATKAEDSTMIKGPRTDSSALAEKDNTLVAPVTKPSDGEDHTVVTAVKTKKADDDPTQQLSTSVDDKTTTRPRK